MIGVLARCEIEYLDAKTARLLEKVAEEARKMETESSTPEASPMFKWKGPARPAVTPAPTRAPADSLDEAAAPPPTVAPAAATGWSLRR